MHCNIILQFTKHLIIFTITAHIWGIPNCLAQQTESQKSEEGPPKKKETSVDISYYLDDRDFNTLTLLTSTNKLPLGFNIWGFTDFHSVRNESDSRTDLNRYFMEYRLRHALDPNWVMGIGGLGVEVEYNDANGSNNNLLRFGFSYKHSLPLSPNRKGWLLWRLFPYETDGSGGQASLAYFIPLGKYAYISGFADLNISEGVSDRWVIEPQLNIKLTETFEIVLEGRYNGFEDANSLDGKGIALGIKLKL